MVEIAILTNLDAMAKLHYTCALVGNTVESTVGHDATADVVDNPLMKPSTNDVRASVGKLHTHGGVSWPEG